MPDPTEARAALHIGSIPAAAKRELDALYPMVAERVVLSCLGCGQATDRFVTGSLVHDDIGLCARCVDAIRSDALPDDGREGLDVERLAAAIERTDWPSFVSIHHPDAADPREDWVGEHWGLWSTEVARAIVAGDRAALSDEPGETHEEPR